MQLTKSGLWLPPTLGKPAGKTYRCNVCETVFPESQKVTWQQHVIKCAERNPVAEDRAEYRNGNAVLSAQDKEQYAWVRRNGGFKKRGRGRMRGSVN